MTANLPVPYAADLADIEVSRSPLARSPWAERFVNRGQPPQLRPGAWVRVDSPRDLWPSIGGWWGSNALADASAGANQLADLMFRQAQGMQAVDRLSLGVTDWRSAYEAEFVPPRKERSRTSVIRIYGFGGRH